MPLRGRMKRLLIILSLLASPAFAQSMTPPQAPPATMPNSEVTAREVLSILNERTSANDSRFTAQEKAVAAALAAAKEAVNKAENAAEKRFDSVNEFRGQLKDQTATFIPRNESEVRFKSIESKIADNETRIQAIISRAEGSAQLWQGITAVLAIGIAAAGLAIAFRNRKAA